MTRSMTADDISRALRERGHGRPRITNRERFLSISGLQHLRVFATAPTKERPRSAVTTHRPHLQRIARSISRCPVVHGSSLHDLPSERTRRLSVAETRIASASYGLLMIMPDRLRVRPQLVLGARIRREAGWPGHPARAAARSEWEGVPSWLAVHRIRSLIATARCRSRPLRWMSIVLHPGCLRQHTPAGRTFV